MKIISLLLAISFWCIQANAQEEIIIGGAKFEVVCNNTTGTAEIRDHKYKIYEENISDYYRYYFHKTRKFPRLKGENKTLEIPESIVIDGYKYTVTSIGRAAFAGYKNFKTVVIPSTVTNISDYAFFYTNIEEIEIPESVTSLGKRVFGQCKKLKKITLPNHELVINEESYAESKECQKDYKKVIDAGLREEITQTTKPKVVNKPKEQTGPSDVDIDIPVVAGSNDETFAIIIANENYQKVSKVNYALNDGRMFNEYCKNVLSIPEDNIFYIEDATYNNIREAMTWMSDVAQAYEGDSRVILYYAGHGIPDESNGTSYILPVDGMGNNISTGYSLNKLYAELGKLPTKNITVFLDACFSGVARDGVTLNEGGRGVAIKAKAGAPQGKMVVFAAAQEDQTANPYSEMGHGLFTYYLLKKLKETKGNVTYGELGKYIETQVKRKSTVTIRKKQEPTVIASSSYENNWQKLKLR